jgi:hypothetical protein
MKFFPVAAAFLFLALAAARADSVRSYELPQFVSVGGLYTNDNGELVVTFTTTRNGKSGDHFWNADKREEVPDADPETIAHDQAAHDAVIARNHLVRLELGIRGKMTLASGSVVSGEWLDAPSACQWLYHAYVKLRLPDGAEKAFAFLIRRRPHLQDLVHQCAGVNGGSFLTVSYVDGSPLFYRRPGGGFYVVVIGMPYVIGFSDDGRTDFTWQGKPIAILSEDRVAAAYKAMAEGKLTPQAAVDSLLAADPDAASPRR